MYNFDYTKVEMESKINSLNESPCALTIWQQFVSYQFFVNNNETVEE